MKKMIFVIAMSVGLVAGASAQNSWNSRTDSFGNTYGTDNRGNSFNSRTDSFGNTYGTDNRGNSWTCHTDSFGNTSCN